MPRIANPYSYHGWRRLVLECDGYACVQCGSKERLECDHIVPASIAPELFYEVSNGRVLCNPCHRKTDTYGAKSKRSFLAKKNAQGGL